MKPLQSVILLISVSIFMAGCTTLPLFNSNHTKDNYPFDPVIHNAGALSGYARPSLIASTIRSLPKTVFNFISQNTEAFIAICSLLVLLTIYRVGQEEEKKPVKLDDNEKAMLLLSVETLTDLWHSIQSKNRAKIIPLRRGN